MQRGVPGGDTGPGAGGSLSPARASGWSGTAAGSRWPSVLGPPSASGGQSKLDEIRKRQAVVSELRPEVDLREDLAGAYGEDARVGVHPEDLVTWAESPNQMTALWLAWAAPWSRCSPCRVRSRGRHGHSQSVCRRSCSRSDLYLNRLKASLEALLHGTENAFHDLDLLSGVLARVESHHSEGPELQRFQRELLSGDTSASRAIAKLRSLVDLINSRHNIFVRIIDAPLMYSVQVAFAAERWRRTHGSRCQKWAATVGELEALLSLAGYSFEHPADPFPEFAEGDAGFEAEKLGHPLLSSAACVRSSASMGRESRVLLISGSNMSGKSTLLRAVGINTVMAMAGVPVRARRMRLTPLHVGASIRVNDSLQEGSSRFYAEITRLRQIHDLAGGEPPLLFLLDELLQGTNSKDRRIGGEGIVRALVGRGAIGRRARMIWR